MFRQPFLLLLLLFFEREIYSKHYSLLSCHSQHNETDSKRFLWIGQNDLVEENVWRYVKPSRDWNTSVYLDWGDGEPNGNTGNHGDQDCVAFLVDDDNFRDKKCNKQFFTVCETINGKQFKLRFTYSIMLP